MAGVMFLPLSTLLFARQNRTLECTFKCTEVIFMSRVRVDEDIRPLSEFRAGVATFVKQLHDNRRPMVLTQRGRGVAVLLDVHEYEKMQERLEILEEVYKAEEQIVSGDGIAHEEARARILSGLAR
jgi:prevent-host-death family protein